MSKKLYVIYDGRAIPWELQPKEVHDMVSERQKKFKDGNKFRKMFFPCNTEGAAVLVSCETLKEARGYKEDFGKGNCIYSYDIKAGNNLINENFVEIL